MKRLFHVFYFLLAMLLSSCSSTKFVGDGEYLLDKVEIKADSKVYKQSELKSYLRQQPNFKVFGLMKWPLFVYDWSGRNEKNWLNKQLRRIGEPPVIMDTMLVSSSSNELKRFLINKGYTDADVTFSIDTLRRKKALVTYHIHYNEPYRIGAYSMSLSDLKMDSIARLKPPRRSSLAAAFGFAPEGYNSLVKEGKLFDRDLLDQERQRITTLLRRNGYYAFNRDYLAYLADSSSEHRMVDLDMRLKLYRRLNADNSITDTTHRQYYIKNVTVVTDYDPLNPNAPSFTPTDTIKKDNLYILYGKRGQSLRPGVLTRSTFITPGKLYNERNVEQTYSAFSALRSIRNVNIRFQEEEVGDTMSLKCVILTTPAKTQGFGGDIEGTNSGGDFGFASSLNYQHRNLFKGSEVFSAKIRGAYEYLSSSTANNYWEIGGEVSVLFPRFLFPFLAPEFSRNLRATSELKFSYNNQVRPEFTRSIISGGWSYIWQNRANTQERHVFKLLDIDYVHLPKISGDFLEPLPEFTRLYNFTDQFIVGTGYTYSFNNFNPQNRLKNTHSLRASFEMAGNFLYAISRLTSANKSEDDFYRLFGINYAQFIKADVDFSKSFVLDSRNQFAFHVGIGVGYPYGNSKVMLPFDRSYFSGGANSVRGWSVRTLGPGSMPIDSVKSFADQIGDIRLDLNVEYRTKLFWKFEMAAYIDAGNIWTMHPQKNREGGNFDFSRFYKEIAVSYGLGLRLDFDFFLLRLDTGLKVYDPQARDKWAILKPNLNVRKGNFAWHFAVGYPF